MSNLGKVIIDMEKGSIDSGLENDPHDYYGNKIGKLMRNIERKVAMYLIRKLI